MFIQIATTIVTFKKFTNSENVKITTRITSTRDFIMLYYKI